jgi:hypothetical protein
MNVLVCGLLIVNASFHDQNNPLGPAMQSLLFGVHSSCVLQSKKCTRFPKCIAEEQPPRAPQLHENRKLSKRITWCEFMTKIRSRIQENHGFNCNFTTLAPITEHTKYTRPSSVRGQTPRFLPCNDSSAAARD